jgi:hypothetical protein
VKSNEGTRHPDGRDTQVWIDQGVWLVQVIRPFPDVFTCPPHWFVRRSDVDSLG